jgi:tetratricopeptide (TPR) repeat protein
MGDYPKTLSSYEKALEISQKSLPPNRPDLATSCYNIDLLYEKMGEYLKARSFYERAVSIVRQSLQSNHHDLKNYRNILDKIKKRNYNYLFLGKKRKYLIENCVRRDTRVRTEKQFTPSGKGKQSLSTNDMDCIKDFHESLLCVNK